MNVPAEDAALIALQVDRNLSTPCFAAATCVEWLGREWQPAPEIKLMKNGSLTLRLTDSFASVLRELGPASVILDDGSRIEARWMYTRSISYRAVLLCTSPS